MSGLIKYRVHEVAKDFNMTSKEITQILTDYATTPKNHMQVLEDAELNDIFEYLTQHHQAASLEELYKVPDQPKGKPQAAPAEAPKSGTAQQPAAQTQQRRLRGVSKALGALARIVRRVLRQQQQACLPGARRRSGVILAERDAPGLAHEAKIVGCFIRVGAPPVPL